MLKRATATITRNTDRIYDCGYCGMRKSACRGVCPQARAAGQEPYTIKEMMGEEKPQVAPAIPPMAERYPEHHKRQQAKQVKLTFAEWMAWLSNNSMCIAKRDRFDALVAVKNPEHQYFDYDDEALKCEESRMLKEFREQTGTFYPESS